MANKSAPSFFARLILPMLDHLRRIAGGTRGEHSIDDLKTEAWLAAQDIRDETGIECEPEDEGLQAAVLARLRKAFGQFVNRKMRFAVQLDHEQSGEDGDRLPNTVAATLAAPDSYEPEISIERAEQAADRERRLSFRFAEAVAFLRSLEHFNGDQCDLASHLAISVGALGSRMRRAERLAECQPSLFDGIESIPRTFLPLSGRCKQSPLPRRGGWKSLCPRVRFLQRRLFSGMPAILGQR